MTQTPGPLYTSTCSAELPEGVSSLTGLLSHLSPSGVWLREGQGMIGLGVAAQTTAHGSERFAQLAHWFQGLDFASHPDSPAPEHPGGLPAELSGTPGSGPLAFTSIAYSSDSAAASRLIVPEVVIGHRKHAGTQQATWVTVITADPGLSDIWSLLSGHGLRLLPEGGREDHAAASGQQLDIIPSAQEPLPETVLRPGSHTEDHYRASVVAGVKAIGERRLEKLVLARDVVVAPSHRLRPAPLLSRLATDYSDCWTYYAGDVLGATPEMLVKVRGQDVSARVLAGTVDSRVPAAEAHSMLLEDPKQLNEHRIAVESLLEQLAPVTEDLIAEEVPHVLELPNVYHLATDIRGSLTGRCDPAEPAQSGQDARPEGPDQQGAAEGPTRGILPPALLVAERAHPTAAICGTPTATAQELISTLEEMDRGPFSGPVGWIDAQGNADFGIALRGGVLEDGGRQIRLYAGCGIVSGSEPEKELAETWAKMRPMLSVLAGH